MDTIIPENSSPCEPTTIGIIVMRQWNDVWAHQCQIGLNLTAGLSVPIYVHHCWRLNNACWIKRINKINKSNFDHFIWFITSFPKAPRLIGNHPVRRASTMWHTIPRWKPRFGGTTGWQSTSHSPCACRYGKSWCVTKMACRNHVQL